jgi:chemotaxis protein methyltransferase CheR
MDLSPTTFDVIRQIVHDLCGLSLGDDKAYLIHDRLAPLVARRGWHGFDQLCQRLNLGQDPRLIEDVIDAMTTRETSFFRDPHIFESLGIDVLLHFAATVTGLKRRLRILSAGVATGQEAYSLAMLCCELLERPGVDSDAVSIVGTDVSTAALLKAQAGLYESRDVARGLNAARAARFFERSGDVYKVRPFIRKLVEFRRVNLCGDLTPLGQFDLICCRNVLIYFDEPTRRRICRQLHAMLTPGGWLFLGAAENLYGVSDDFDSVRIGEGIIYRKI